LVIEFPNLSASNIEGRRFKLPRDFLGRMNIIIIAFRREQQILIDEWIPFLKVLIKNYPEIEFYELPTVGTSYFLIRWFINGGMREGIQDKRTRERTITLYLNKRDFRKQLKIPNEDTIYLFLLDTNSQVIWSDKGNFTKQKGIDLENVIKGNMG
jgi:hypothetical protein